LAVQGFFRICKLALGFGERGGDGRRSYHWTGCMAGLLVAEVKTNGTGLGPLGLDPVPDRFFGVFRN